MVGQEKVDMRSSSFARVVIAGLAVSVVITLGCGKPPSAPSETATVTVGDLASPFVFDGWTRNDPIYLESTPARWR